MRPAKPPRDHRRRILIVDDEPAIVESLAAALSPPYRVEAVSNGQAALSFLKAESTDLIILDLHLGAEDGLELLPRLRQLTPAPVLILTGCGSRETLLQSIRAKPDDFLDKPVDVSVLRGRIAALLDGGSPEGDPLERVRARIAHELDRPFRSQDLARLAGMSPSHLRRSFSARFGTSPRAYLEKRRMDRATALLRETSLPIKEIAAHARREKSIRHGHISTLHIWWARLPLPAATCLLPRFSGSPALRFPVSPFRPGAPVLYGGSFEHVSADSPLRIGVCHQR